VYSRGEDAAREMFAITMVYNIKWQDLRNAVGFAAECVRLVEPLYIGDDEKDKLAIARVIEIAKAYINVAYAAAYAADAVYTVTRTSSSSNTIDDLYNSTSVVVATAALYVIRAARTSAVVEKIFLRWWVKDLGGDPDSEKGQAAMTALMIGCEDAAREMLYASS